MRYDWFDNIQYGDWIKIRYQNDVGYAWADLRTEVLLLEIDEIHKVEINGELDLEKSFIGSDTAHSGHYCHIPLRDIVEIIEIRPAGDSDE